MMGGSSGLTNTAIVGPDGTQWLNDRNRLPAMQAMIGKQFAELGDQTSPRMTNNTLTPGGTEPQFSYPQAQPPETRMVKPSFQQAASMGAPAPGMGNALSPGLSKAGKLLTILTSGIQGALAGRAANEQAAVASGGRRAGGAGMGFEAGVSYPWQRAEQQQALERGQAQTGLLQAEQQNVNVPGVGVVPSWLARTMGPAWLRQQGQLGAAQIGATGRQNVAETEAQSREQIAGMAKPYYVLPGLGLYDSRKQQVVPGTAQGATVTPDLVQAFGLPPDTVGQHMTLEQFRGFEAQQLARAPKVTTGESVQTDAQGNLVKVPTTHVTQPILPNTGGAPTPTARSTGGGGTVRPVTNAQGQPIQSQGGAAKGAKWMTWSEDGRTVAGPMSMAQQRGAQNPAELPQQEVRDVQNARHAVNLLSKQGDPKKPESQGVLQLIDSLDKDGKLGVLASRWNSFMTSGVGASPDDDPRIVTLINKNMLGDTATMLAHFGASGGRSPQMLQHFLDLSNSRKMDGVTLRAGTRAILDYMQDRAMIPGERVANAPAPSGTIIQYDVNGKRVAKPASANP
jgi:hypothetical protein